ncbi:MAG: serine hydrolase domain-containing protein [Puniceicoccales bacterium]
MMTPSPSIPSLPPQDSPETLGFCSTRLQRADALVQRFIDEEKLAGAITLVARGDGIAHLGMLGYSDIANREPMRENTLFRIYSMTKIITSVALMITYERGLVDLNDPVSNYIPAFAHQKLRREDGRLIDPARPTTIYDLLRHCGGLEQTTRVEDLLRSEHTLESFAEEMGKTPLIAEPGTTWIYGYSTDILARIIEIVSGQKFDEFLQAEIFQPLGMVDTGFDLPADRCPQLAVCYRAAQNGGLTVSDSNGPESLFARKKSFLSGSAGLLSSTRDYLRFATMLLHQGTLEGVRILGRKTVELMTMDHLPQDHPNLEIGTQSFRFGLGVSVVTDIARTRCLSSLGDFGWGGAAGTQVWINPEEDMIVMIMIQVRAEIPTGIMDVYKRLVYQALT